MQKRPPLVWLAVPLLLAACSSVPKPEKIPGSEVIHLAGKLEATRFKLSNGLRVIVVEDHSSPTFAYQTWFDVGSKNETPGYTGLAHLFEHMMFKGTRKYPEGKFDETLERSGAENYNASTSQDYTDYTQELPSDKLDMIVELEADRMVNLVVDEKSFSTEREVVQNERRFRTENSPDGTLYQELFGIAFQTHPYRWPVIGYEEDLARMSAQDAEAFYKAHYAPNHAVVVVAGDVTPQQVHETLQRHYGSIPAVQTQPKVLPSEPSQTAARRKTLKLSTQVDKLLVGYRIPSESHEDSPALSLIQSVLTNGKSARLQRALVETGVANGVFSADIDGSDPTLFIVGANLQKGRKAPEAEAIIRQELKRLATENVGEAELERARNQLSFQFYAALDNNHSRAAFIGRYEVVVGGAEKALDIFQKTLATGPEALRKTASRYFQDQNRTVVIGAPK
jgi:zinc protease